MDADKNKVFRLEGKVQNYAWGGVSFLPHLLNEPNPDHQPFAEYWLGAHDQASASIILDDGKRRILNEYIRQFKEETLGMYVARCFGRLPYLLKILDVRDMLSIQVHPSKQSAEKEFEEENKKGIPLSAGHRNYKDDNHKPELMLALGEFWLLHGFKPRAQLMRTLQYIPELNFLIPFLEKGYADLYHTVMSMDQEEINRRLQPLLDRIVPAYQEGLLEKNNENFWAARAALTFNGAVTNPIVDRGIFSIYFFNLVHLHPGEAIFQDAGLPHAYLEGQNIEIMANSDNVLRGGLTPKHIDVAALMKHIHFKPTVPHVLREENEKNHISLYVTSAADFELCKVALKKDETTSILSSSTEIFIVLKGKVLIQESDQNEFLRTTGQAWLGFDKAAFYLKAEEDMVAYLARVPGIGDKA
jgi:mannose-6-phosphate isomerase